MNNDEDNKPFVFRLSFLRKKYDEQLKRRDRYSLIEKALRAYSYHWRSRTPELHDVLHRIDGTSKTRRQVFPPYTSSYLVPEVPRLQDTVPVVNTIFKPRFTNEIYHQQGSVQFSTVSTYEPICTYDPDWIYGVGWLQQQDQKFLKVLFPGTSGVPVLEVPKQKTIQVVKVPNRYVKWYKSTKPFKKPRLGHRHQNKWVQDDIPWNLQEFLPKSGNKILKHRRYPIGLPTVLFDTIPSDVLRIILQYSGYSFNVDNLGERKLTQKDSTIYRWLRGLPSEDIDKNDSTTFLFADTDSDTETYSDTCTDYFNWPYNIYYKGV